MSKASRYFIIPTAVVAESHWTRVLREDMLWRAMCMYKACVAGESFVGSNARGCFVEGAV